MEESCPEGQFWDALLKLCINCQSVCQEQQVISKCISYCESAHCKALPGHYYDVLLKKCMRCTEICGKHPAECSQHCQTPTALEDSTVLLYSLLALCIVLLFSSLSLTLAVFLRGSGARASNPGPKKANHKQERLIQPGEEVGLPGGQLRQTSKDYVTHSRSNDSSPTETCVCVHCFPDLKPLAQGNDRLLRAPVLPRGQTQNGGPLWAEKSLHTSGPGGGSSEMRSICSLSNQSVSQENWNG
ncbi:tumor necrosis factor receptor superfamily member 13B [Seriola dumerili]|uniref:tumor necrosis factor receptor superfamily member 13B n=1 Tax=Seriola dumerili TaxID=41447 RepID=UPI000BBE29EB|nr:tumor necrosis factor receptor superfamily member 13B [Seriola dumerili]